MHWLHWLHLMMLQLAFSGHRQLSWNIRIKDTDFDFVAFLFEIAVYFVRKWNAVSILESAV